jgi:hypothetical protein
MMINIFMMLDFLFKLLMGMTEDFFFKLIMGRIDNIIIMHFFFKLLNGINNIMIMELFKLLKKVRHHDFELV